MKSLARESDDREKVKRFESVWHIFGIKEKEGVYGMFV